MLRIAIGLFLPMLLAADAPTPLAPKEAAVRLRRALHIAKETNQAGLVESINESASKTSEAFKRNDRVAAEVIVQTAERLVGLDGGGLTMHGLPVAQISKEMQQELDDLAPKLAKAMAEKDSKQIADRITAMKKILGEQAGIPDVRNKPDKAKISRAISNKEVADLFVDVLLVDRRVFEGLSQGKRIPNALPRTYAYTILGCCQIRPLIQEHRKADLEKIDNLVDKCCKILLELQTPTGYFKFPDLRGKHIRFGEMIERAIKANPDAVKDGWVEVIDPSGGSQFDAGECGMALLLAGSTYQKEAWTRAGLLAADWSMSQPSVPNFNYNAFSISLLCRAFTETKDPKYLKGAIEKFTLGIAPGQHESGRWLDYHNARTTYHLLILRGLNDLLEQSSHLDSETLKKLRSVSDLARKPWLEEIEKHGTGSLNHSLPELVTTLKLNPDLEKRLRPLLLQTSGAILEACYQDGKPRAGVALQTIPWMAGLK